MKTKIQKSNLLKALKSALSAAEDQDAWLNEGKSAYRAGLEQVLTNLENGAELEVVYE